MTHLGPTRAAALRGPVPKERKRQKKIKKGKSCIIGTEDLRVQW